MADLLSHRLSSLAKMVYAVCPCSTNSWSHVFLASTHCINMILFMITYIYLPFCYIAIPQYVFLARLKHNKPNKASLKVTITKGTSSARTTSSGGSTSFTVSGEVGASILKIFSVKLGLSATTGFNWSSSSTATSIEEVKHEVSVEVNPGDEVHVYQVVGECANSDGTKYTLKTGRYETRGKNGETLGTSDIPPEEGTK